MRHPTRPETTTRDLDRTEPASRRHIGLLLFDDVEELDAVGPWEVLAYWTQQHPEDGWAVSCLSADGAHVTGAKGLVLGAHHSLADAPALDVLIHPGGQGTRPLLRDPEHLDWVRAQRAAVPLMTWVCTGSLVYAAAGLLTGRPATTHWASLNLLSELDPTVDVPTSRPGSSTTATSSPAPGSPPASTWPCTWSPGSRAPNAPARSAAASSTTRTLRSSHRLLPV